MIAYALEAIAEDEDAAGDTIRHTRRRTDDEQHSPRLDQTVLDEHLERFREVFDEAAIGMATVTLTGSVVRANRALATLLGRTAPELIGVAYADLMEKRGDLFASALRDIRDRPLDVIQVEHGVTGTADDRLVRSTLAERRPAVRR